MTWATSAEVRRRGTVRARRRTAAAAFACALVAAAGTALVATGAQRSPTPPAVSITTAPTPTTTALTTAGMLTPTDLGAGYQHVTSNDAREGDDAGSLAALLAYCGRPEPDVATSALAGSRRRLLSAGTDGEFVIQEVVRFRAGRAAGRIAAVRSALQHCRTVAIGGDQNNRITLAEAATAFAGDESLLITERPAAADGDTVYHSVVRTGDVEIRLHIKLPGLSLEQARAITIAATRRLCQATRC